MTKNTVSIELDRESLARLLGSLPVATGVHCGDDRETLTAFAAPSRWECTAATTSTAKTGGLCSILQSPFLFQ